MLNLYVDFPIVHNDTLLDATVLEVEESEYYVSVKEDKAFPNFWSFGEEIYETIDSDGNSVQRFQFYVPNFDRTNGTEPCTASYFLTNSIFLVKV